MPSTDVPPGGSQPILTFLHSGRADMNVAGRGSSGTQVRRARGWNRTAPRGLGSGTGGPLAAFLATCHRP